VTGLARLEPGQSEIGRRAGADARASGASIRRLPFSCQVLALRISPLVFYGDEMNRATRHRPGARGPVSVLQTTVTPVLRLPRALV